MNRRDAVLALLALGAGPLAARAEQTEKTYRVGYIVTTTPIGEMAGPDPLHPPTRGLLHELRALGNVEGRNLIFERRSGEGHPQRFPPIVAGAGRPKTDVIVLGGSSLCVSPPKEGAGKT